MTATASQLQDFAPTAVNWMLARRGTLLLILSGDARSGSARRTETRIFELDPAETLAWEALTQSRFVLDHAQHWLQELPHAGHGRHLDRVLREFYSCCARAGVLEVVRRSPPFNSSSATPIPSLLDRHRLLELLWRRMDHRAQVMAPLSLLERRRRPVLSFSGPPYRRWATQLGPLAAYRPSFYPMKVNLDLTSRCNQRCRHCYFYAADDGAPPLVDLPLPELARVIDVVHRDGIRCINLMGGEPFVREDIFDIIQHIKARGIYLSINTNGTLLDDRRVAALRELGVDQLRISLDGATAATYGSVRQAASFDTCRRNIQRATRAGVEVQINFTLTRTNLADFLPMIGLARQLGARSLSIKRFNTIGRGQQSHSQIGLSPLHYSIFHLARKIFPVLSVASGVEIFLNNLCDSAIYAHIDTSGRVHFCTQMGRDMPYGSLFSQGLLALWHSPAHFHHFDIAAIKPPCQGCLFFTTCNSWRCRAEAYARTGDFFAGSRPCRRGSFSARLKRATTIIGAPGARASNPGHERDKE